MEIMPTFPTLTSERLNLRLFRMEDAATVQRLAGVPEVALMTLHIPHPYPDGAAEGWIATHAAGFEHGTAFIFAICRRSDGRLMGAISLMLEQEHDTAELGYWLGVPFWNQGYATEAAAALLEFGFETLGLRRIFARHFRHNPASGRVMRKLGMVYEGRARQMCRRADSIGDEESYGILAGEWRENRPRRAAVDPIRPIEPADRTWVESLLREEWGGVEVVSRGRILHPADLPGFVALLAGERQGLATYRIDGGDCELVTLNSLCPRLGLGRRLIEAVRSAAAGAGCRRLWLITTNDNTGALAFYQHLGFRLAALHRGAIAESRRLKPAIPETGSHGIPIRDELELEMDL
jgi:ribosomal-protein-alanine N-acetyltransferase